MKEAAPETAPSPPCRPRNGSRSYHRTNTAPVAGNSPRSPRNAVGSTASAVGSPASAGGRFVSSAGLILQQFQQQDHRRSRRPCRETASSSSSSAAAAADSFRLDVPAVANTAGAAENRFLSHAGTAQESAPMLLQQQQQQPFPTTGQRHASGGASTVSTISTLSMDSLDTSNRSLSNGTNNGPINGTNHNGSPRDYNFRDGPPQVMLTIPGRPPATVLEETHASNLGTRPSEQTVYSNANTNTNHTAVTQTSNTRHSKQTRVSIATAVISNRSDVNHINTNPDDSATGASARDDSHRRYAQDDSNHRYALDNTGTQPADTPPRITRRNSLSSLSIASNSSIAQTKSALRRFDQRLWNIRQGNAAVASAASQRDLDDPQSSSLIGRERQFRMLKNAIDQVFKSHAKSSVTAVPSSESTVGTSQNASATLNDDPRPATATNHPDTIVTPAFVRRRTMKQQQRPFVGRTKSNDQDILRAMLHSPDYQDEADNSDTYDHHGIARSKGNILIQDNTQNIPASHTVVQNAAPAQPRSWTVVSGPVGSGKSTLINHVVQQCQRSSQRHGFFVHVPLSSHQTDQPLATIQLFIEGLCRQIVQLPRKKPLSGTASAQTSFGTNAAPDPRRFHDLQQDIQTNLGIMERTVLHHILHRSLFEAIFSSHPSGIAGAAIYSSKKSAASSASTTSVLQEISSFAEWRYQYQNALIQFLFVVSSYCPIIWITENIQYSDAQSIELMTKMIQTTTLPFLGIVTCHSTANSGTLPTIIRSMYQQLEETKRTRFIRLTFIELEHFTQEQTQEYIEYNYLPTTSSLQVLEFAEYLQKMTSGNILFIEYYLRALLQMEALQYQADTNDYLLQNTVSNIATLLRKRIKLQRHPISMIEFCKCQLSGTVFTSPTAATLSSLRAPSTSTYSIRVLARHVLSIVACLGVNSFPHSMIQYILNGLCREPHDAFFQQYFEFAPSILAESTKLNAMMKICQEEGWICELSGAPIINVIVMDSNAKANVDRYYLFSHETIQQAACSMISEGKLSEFQYRIGDILFREYNHHHNNSLKTSSQHQATSPNSDLLFLVTNFINIRLDLLPRNDPAKRYDIAKLNHLAGQCAIRSCCSFLAASNYYKTAIRLLPSELEMDASTTSDDMQQVSCEYYSNAAECAQCNQNYEQMRLYCSTVMGMITPSKKQLLLQNVRVYHVFMDSILQQLSNIDRSLMVMNVVSTKTITTSGIHGATTTAVQPTSSSSVLINTQTNTAVSGTNAFNTTTVNANGEVFNVIDMGLDILSQLGIHFPKGLRKNMRGLFNGGGSSNKLSVEKISPNTIRLLPYIDSNLTHSAIMKTLDKIITAAYYTKPGFLPWAVTRSVRRTLEYGITNDSPPAFALMGLLLTYFESDFSTGKAYAEHAVAMIQRGRGDSMPNQFSVDVSGKTKASKRKGKRPEERQFYFSTECRTMYICYGMVLNWTAPWETCREPLLDAYQAGMASGDVESAMWCMHYYLDSSWNTGSLLVALDRDFSTYTKICQDTNQPLQYVCLCMNWQVVLNLRGLNASNRRTVLTGDAFDERVILQQIQRSSITGSSGSSNDSVARNLSLLQLILNRYKLCAAMYFGEWEVACTIGMNIMDEYCKKLPGQSGCIYVTYISGLAAFILSKHKAKDKKYKRHGRKCRSKLKDWADRGNPNCVHYVAMLDGEQDSSRGLVDMAARHFELAIKLTGRRGIVQDQAIAHERLAESWLYHGDTDNARYHFKEALRLYGEWGADRKVELLHGQCMKAWKSAF